MHTQKSSSSPAQKPRRAVPWLLFVHENFVTNEYQSTLTLMMGPLTVNEVKLVPSYKYQVQSSVGNTYTLGLDKAVDGGTGKASAEVA